MNAADAPKQRKVHYSLLTDEEFRAWTIFAVKLQTTKEELLTEILREVLAREEEK